MTGESADGDRGVKIDQHLLLLSFIKWQYYLTNESHDYLCLKSVAHEHRELFQFNSLFLKRDCIH